MAYRKIKEKKISQIPESPRPYRLGYPFDNRESTALCIMKLAFMYLEERFYNPEKVLKECQEYSEDFVKKIYNVPRKDVIFPKRTCKTWGKTLQSFGKYLYWDLKDIGMNNLAQFIYNDYTNY